MAATWTPCEVLQDGRWLRGQVLAWRRLPNGRWRAVVRYTAGVGKTYEHARDQAEVRSAQRPVTDPER